MAKITERIPGREPYSYLEIEAEHAAEWLALRAEVLKDYTAQESQQPRLEAYVVDGVNQLETPVEGTGATETLLGVEDVARELGATIGASQPLSKAQEIAAKKAALMEGK